MCRPTRSYSNDHTYANQCVTLYALLSVTTMSVLEVPQASNSKHPVTYIHSVFGFLWANLPGILTVCAIALLTWLNIPELPTEEARVDVSPTKKSSSFFYCHVPKPAGSSLNSRSVEKRGVRLASGMWICTFGPKVTCCQTVRSGLSCSPIMEDIQPPSACAQRVLIPQQAHQREPAGRGSLRRTTMDGCCSCKRFRGTLFILHDAMMWWDVFWTARHKYPIFVMFCNMK